MIPTDPQLAGEIAAVEWHWLRPHHEQGRLYVVAAGLDLAAVALAVARDDCAAVHGWLAAGTLAKADADQLARWNADPTRALNMLIVQPFVLVQERPTTH